MLCGSLRFRRMDEAVLPGPVVRALAFLATTDFSGLQPGRIELEEGLYAILAEEETSPVSEGEWEAHRRYVDVQCVLEGEESIGWALDEERPLRRHALAEEDCLYFEPPENPSWLHLSPGHYAVFFPRDLHCPLRHPGSPRVRKVVVKIDIALFPLEATDIPQ